MNSKYLIYCHGGGGGWGQTGQIGIFICESVEQLQTQLPGGWAYIYLCDTYDPPSFNTNLQARGLQDHGFTLHDPIKWKKEKEQKDA